MKIERLNARPGPSKRGEGIVYLDPITGLPRCRTPSTDVALSGSGGGGAPSGAAGGDLGGTYPNPTATQARGLRETSGPTTLTVGAVADLSVVTRSGTTVAGVAPPASGSRIGQVLGWLADGTIGWVALGVAAGILGADVVSGQMVDVIGCTIAEVL